MIFFQLRWQSTSRWAQKTIALFFFHLFRRLKVHPVTQILGGSRIRLHFGNFPWEREGIQSKWASCPWGRPCMRPLCHSLTWQPGTRQPLAHPSSSLQQDGNKKWAKEETHGLRLFNKATKEILILLGVMIIANMQNKLYTTQLFSPPDDQFVARKYSNSQPREGSKLTETKKSQ